MTPLEAASASKSATQAADSRRSTHSSDDSTSEEVVIGCVKKAIVDIYNTANNKGDPVRLAGEVAGFPCIAFGSSLEQVKGRMKDLINDHIKDCIVAREVIPEPGPYLSPEELHDEDEDYQESVVISYTLPQL